MSSRGMDLMHASKLRATSQLGNIIRKGSPPGTWEAYGFAVICFAVATLIRLSLNLVSPNIQSFATYYPAVLFAALVAGRGAGLLAMTLSATMGGWAFSPPYFATTLPSGSEMIDLALFIASALVIIWGAVAYRTVLWRLHEEENFREATVNELTHRVKNNLTTVYAILRHELRNQPETWDKVSGRLHALSATDEFVCESANETASLRNILVMESTPYGSSRFLICGPDIHLPRKLAITSALILHELATNAAKYGALSNSSGHVFVSWKSQRERVHLSWMEQGGPEVVPPTRRGFGRSLLERGLDCYNGEIDLSFAPEGLRCNISFSTSEGCAE